MSLANMAVYLEYTLKYIGTLMVGQVDFNTNLYCAIGLYSIMLTSVPSNSTMYCTKYN